MTRTILNTRLLAACLPLLAGAAISSAQCGAIKMIPLIPEESSKLGNTLAFDLVNNEQRLAVGATGYDVAPYFNTGRVYMMGKVGNQWGELSHIDKPADPYNGDEFGASIGYSDPYLIIGCPGHLTNSGRAYIYERFGPTWTLKTTIAHTEFGQRMGESVAMDGIYAIVGAPNTDFDGNPSPGNNNADSGAAYIYKRSADGTWASVYTINHNDWWGSYVNLGLGKAVAMKGNIAVLGLGTGTQPAQPFQHGWIQVYRRDALGVWAPEGADFISPVQNRIAQQFGTAVATDGTRIIVGAPGYALLTSYGDASDISAAGAAFIMRLHQGQWVTEDTLLAPKPTAGSRFGDRVAIEGNYAVVGSTQDKTVCVYRRTASSGWVLDRTYIDEDTAGAGTFASSVAISATQVFIGDTGDDHSSLTDAGAVYIKPLPAGNSDSCQGAIVVEPGNHGGCTADASVDGSSTCGQSVFPPGPDVWYAWTPRCSGNCIIDTFGSSYDTILSVHGACPVAGNTYTVQCNDDGDGVLGNRSLVTFNYTPDTTYLIRVSGYNGAKGDFILRLNQFQNEPANNACSTPTTVNPGTVAFKTCAASTDGPTDDGPFHNDEDMGKDVWFKYSSPIKRKVTLDTCGSTFDTILQVFGQSVCPVFNTQAVIANDDTAGCLGGSASRGSKVQFMAQPNQAYLIRVGGYTNSLTGADSGDGVLNVVAVCMCDANSDGNMSIDDLFFYLNQYFNGDAAADMNSSNSTTVDDLFLFLNCWFGGCA